MDHTPPRRSFSIGTIHMGNSCSILFSAMRRNPNKTNGGTCGKPLAIFAPQTSVASCFLSRAHGCLQSHTPDQVQAKVLPSIGSIAVDPNLSLETQFIREIQRKENSHPKVLFPFFELSRLFLDISTYPNTTKA